MMSVPERYAWLTSASVASCFLACWEASTSTTAAFRWLAIITAIIGLALVVFNGQRLHRALRHELRQRSR